METPPGLKSWAGLTRSEPPGDGFEQARLNPRCFQRKLSVSQTGHKALLAKAPQSFHLLRSLIKLSPPPPSGVAVYTCKAPTSTVTRTGLDSHKSLLNISYPHGHATVPGREATARRRSTSFGAYFCINAVILDAACMHPSKFAGTIARPRTHERKIA